MNQVLLWLNSFIEDEIDHGQCIFLRSDWSFFNRIIQVRYVVIRVTIHIRFEFLDGVLDIQTVS